MKAQSAIEYLMTYGWMLLVVAIAGGAVFSVVQGQNIESVSGFQGDNLRIDNFGANYGILSMSLQGQSSDIVTVHKLEAIDDSNNKTIPLNVDLSLSKGKVVNLPFFRPASESNEIQIRFTYDMGGLQNISSEGAIVGDLEMDDSIVGYWPLNSNFGNETNIVDLSEHGNDGSNESDPQIVDDPEKGEVMEFDGVDDAVNMGGDGPELSKSFTLAAWAKAEENYTDDRGGILGYRDQAILNTRGTEVYVNIRRSDGNWVAAHYHDIGSEMFDWNHYAHVYDYDEGVQHLYVNGRKVNSQDVGQIEINPLAERLVGKMWNNWFFEGRIGSPIAYNRALSPGEVRSLSKYNRIIE